VFKHKILLNVYDFDSVTEDGLRELVAYRRRLLDAGRRVGAPSPVMSRLVARLQYAKKQLMLKRQKEYDIGGEG
jgi:hypothetical protein